MKNPKVSVIITTKNESKNIGACLKSLKEQSYKCLEVILVDNQSNDSTQQIAKKYTSLIFDKGPERSAQRNFGALKSTGKYILFLDADMILTKNVILDCVEKIVFENVGGIIIPEKSFGEGFWAACKALERSFYIGNDAIEAARFFDKEKFLQVKGFDESLTGPEDWDISQKIKERFGLARIKEYILHNEGKLSLLKTLKKKHYYAKKFSCYIKKKNNKQYANTQLSIFRRYAIFFSHPQKLFVNPILGLGMLFMKTAEFGVGVCGFLEGRYANQ